MMSRFASFFGGRGDEEEEDQQPPPAPPASSPPKQQQQQQQSSSTSNHKNRPRSSLSTSSTGGGGGGGGGKHKHGNGSGGGNSKRKAKGNMGGISPSSAKALNKLEEYAKEVQRLETEVDGIAEAMSDYPRTPRTRLLECKDQIAQMNGNLEKLQYAGVDSIITADLDTGKELAKEKRKALNQRCDALRERILEHSNQLNKMLAAKK